MKKNRPEHLKSVCLNSNRRIFSSRPRHPKIICTPQVKIIINSFLQQLCYCSSMSELLEFNKEKYKFL